MKRIILMAAAAIMLAAGNVQARLGWTLDDCQNLWGSPVKVGYVSSIDQTCYTFRAQSNLFTEVYVLNGHVHDIVYCSKDKAFLKSNAYQLLQKNYSGAWNLYDDGRGKETLYSWATSDGNGQTIAYALFWNHPDGIGFYKLQVATGLWNDFITNIGQSLSTTGLNI